MTQLEEEPSPGRDTWLIDLLSNYSSVLDWTGLRKNTLLSEVGGSVKRTAAPKGQPLDAAGPGPNALSSRG